MSISNMVSIVMPVYNSEQYLAAAIESIIQQTYSNWELLIIDDCSKDASCQLLRNFAERDSRIKPFFLKENHGAAKARNKGISLAQGQFIAFLDSDDLWFPQKLEIQITFMQKNNYAFSYTSYNLISEDGQDLKRYVQVPERINYKQALTHTAISTITVMIDLRQLDKFEMPDIRAAQDTATWLMLLKRIKYAYGINQILSSYRQVPNSISSSIMRRIKRQWNVYRKIEGFTRSRSVVLYVQYIYYVLQKRKRK